MPIDISEWLQSLGLGTYAESFRDNHIDVETLPSLTMDDLREMGIASVGHRRRILAAIESLGKAEPAAEESTATPPGDLRSERRQVTVLFADIAGFTTLSSELDAEQVHALLSTFFEKVDRIIAEFGGRIDKHIGDCAMAVFGAPVAHTDDVRRAAAAALAIHAAMTDVSKSLGRAIAAHVGIASGEVLASNTGSSSYTEYTVTGETVNLASRLTGLAPDGETIVSADIIATLGEAAEAEFAGSQSVKGLAAPVETWRLTGLRAAEGHDRPLIGRRTELAQCLAALREARDGETGAVVYVRGEPGIGKSSLAAEMLRRARELGFACLRAAVFDFGAALDRDPLRSLALSLLSLTEDGAVTDALARVASADALGEAEVLALKDLIVAELSPEEHRWLEATEPSARLAARGEALARLALAAGRSAPLLIVVEDVHWADTAALHGLAAMARGACGASQTVAMFTSRTERDPLATLQPLMSGVPLMMIELGQLREQDARELATCVLDAADPLIEQCVARAGGNPLFLEQLIRHARAGGLASAIPGSIRSVVAAQIDRLSAPDRTALQAAAVLGNQFSPEALRHLLERSDWSPSALIANRLVHPEGDVLQFTHALIRDGAYATIISSERHRLHRAAARWFAERDTALRAEHLARAGDPAAVAAYLEAVEEEIAHYRVEKALDLLGRASSIAKEPADSFAVHLRQGDILTELGRSAEAIAAYDQALEAAPDERAKAAGKLGKAGTLRLLDQNEEALGLLQEAEPVFAAGGGIAELARLEHLRGNLYYPLGESELCRAAHEKALAFAEQCGSLELKASALGGLGDAAYASGRYVTAGLRFGECVELARQHGFGRVEVANAPMLASVMGHAETSLEAGRRAVAAAAATHHPRAELTGLYSMIIVLLWCARPEAVGPHFERAQEIVRQLGARRFQATNLTLMGEAYRQLGDRARAAALHDEALAIARQGGMSYVGAIVLGLRAAAVFDDAHLRNESLREGERCLLQASVSHNALFFYIFAIESSLFAGEWDEARRYADLLAERFAAERVPFIDFLVERGRLLAELGENGPSAPLLQALERCRDDGRAIGFAYFDKRLDEVLRVEGSSRVASAAIAPAEARG